MGEYQTAKDAKETTLAAAILASKESSSNTTKRMIAHGQRAALSTSAIA
jgi:hypothetical protein